MRLLLLVISDLSVILQPADTVPGIVIDIKPIYLRGFGGVAQALLLVAQAWNALALATGRSACAITKQVAHCGVAATKRKS
jgi:hypothetical protein